MHFILHNSDGDNGRVPEDLFGGNADGPKAGMKCMPGSTPGAAVSGTPAGENKLTVYPSVAGRGDEIRVKWDSEKPGDALLKIFSFPDRRLPGQDRIRNGLHVISGVRWRDPGEIGFGKARRRSAEDFQLSRLTVARSG